jgi:hypothetical protein
MKGAQPQLGRPSYQRGEKDTMSERSNNSGALIGGALMIAFGLLALAGQLLRNVFNWTWLWPFSIIAFGVLFFVVMLAGGRRAAAFAIPGSIITGIGLILLFQNLTGMWETWSYGWTLILMAVGIGITLMGLWEQNPDRQLAGLRVLRVGFILFVIFGAFFELRLNPSAPITLRTYFFPGLLILVGAYLILTRTGILPSLEPRRPAGPSPTSSEQEQAQ